MIGVWRISRNFALGMGVFLGLCGCNSVAGLSDYSVSGDTESSTAECETNSQCTEAATAAAATGESVLAACVKPEGRCVKLLSEDCTQITGELSDNAILIGSMFATAGAQGQTNVQRQASAMLATEQINDVGGVPGAAPGTSRKLVMVSCNASPDPRRAARHLANALKVPAIVGPNTSQDTLDVSEDVTIPAGTVVISPTAVASSIASLIDDDLTWLMAPTDVQRAPLMSRQINAIEARLRDERDTETIKLGLAYRDDALGLGTRSGLNSLVINGKPLSHVINLGNNVHINPYDGAKPDQNAIVDEYLEFAPDIVVLAGLAEAITMIMKPLEERWPANRKRPHYMLTDQEKIPELVTLVTGNDDLRSRIRGTGVTPSPRSMPVFDAFKVDYQVAHPGSANISGLGPARDATYAIAFALAATRTEPVSGASIKKGLRQLAGGSTVIEIGPTRLLQAFQKLGSGEAISAIGTFSGLEWDVNGAVMGGTLEMWCLGAPGGKPTYQSAGLTFDLMTQKEEGSYTQCAP